MATWATSKMCANSPAPETKEGSLASPPPDTTGAKKQEKGGSITGAVEGGVGSKKRRRERESMEKATKKMGVGRGEREIESREGWYNRGEEREEIVKAGLERENS